MSSHLSKGLFHLRIIFFSSCSLVSCSEQYIIVNIDPTSDDPVDHYAVCTQVGDTRYDLFRIPKDTPRFVVRTDADIAEGTNLRMTVRSIDSNYEILGSGSASNKINSNWRTNQIGISLVNFPDSYRNCYSPGFCTDPKYSPADTAWYGVWLADTGDEGWAVGADVMAFSDTAIRPRISHYQNGQWTLIADHMLPNGITTQPIPIYAVWGSDKSNVWAAGGNGTLLYWDGKTWENISNRNPCGTGNNLYGVWGLKQPTLTAQMQDDCRVWVVGDNGTVICFNGGSWDCSKKVQLTSNRIPVLRKIWGNSSSDIWVVGGYSKPVGSACPVYELILKRDGNQWTEEKLDNIEHCGFITSVSGIDTSNIWAVADTAKILRWDGKNWMAKLPQPTNSQIDFSATDGLGKFINGFNSVWVGGQNDVLMSMYSGKILHWHKDSGSVESWAVSNFQSGGALLALSGGDACNMLVAGHRDYRGVYLPDAPSAVR